MHLAGWHTHRSHVWGGDRSLLFPRRLSHHSTSLTPPGSSGLHLQALHPFHGLRFIVPSSAPGLPPFGDPLTTRQTSLHVADWWVAPSLKKARPHASTPGSLHTSGGCFKGGFVPPLTGLSPVSRHEHQDAPLCADRGRRGEEGVPKRLVS